jgi:cell division transport system permease protein
MLVHVMRRAYENVRRSPVTAGLTTVTIAVALFLFGVFLLVVRNCSVAISQDSGDVMVNVFLKDSVAPEQAKELAKELRPIIDGVDPVYTDKAQALTRFRKLLGEDAAVLEGLESSNPLPASLDIKLNRPEQAERVYLALSEKLKEDSRVEVIRYSRGVIQQLKRILKILEVGGIVGVAFILAITGFIIANTIKLALYTHRMEVEIMQLVGARRGAIYAPYVLEGLLQGIIGALAGGLLVLGVFLLIQDAFLETEILRFIFPQFQFLALSEIAMMILAGGLVGMVGSFLAVRRFLRVEE